MNLISHCYVGLLASILVIDQSVLVSRPLLPSCITSSTSTSIFHLDLPRFPDCQFRSARAEVSCLAYEFVLLNFYCWTNPTIIIPFK